MTTSFASAARIAAHRHKVPRLELTIYPQQIARLPGSQAFASAYRALVARQAAASGLLDIDNDLVTELAWGVSRTSLLLHDPALLSASDSWSGAVRSAVGFPYFDDLPVRPGQLEDVEAWLARHDGPVIAVTAGSFLGARQRQLWSDAAQAVKSLGIRALFIGPQRGQHGIEQRWPADVLVADFLPLSQIAPRVAAVIHHGGIGTMFATLAAGRPAAVLPQAFDQPHNARLLAQAGVGTYATRSSLKESLTRLLENAAFTERATRLAETLIPSDVATSRVVSEILVRGRDGGG